MVGHRAGVHLEKKGAHKRGERYHKRTLSTSQLYLQMLWMLWEDWESPGLGKGAGTHLLSSWLEQLWDRVIMQCLPLHVWGFLNLSLHHFLLVVLSSPPMAQPIGTPTWHFSILFLQRFLPQNCLVQSTHSCLWSNEQDFIQQVFLGCLLESCLAQWQKVGCVSRDVKVWTSALLCDLAKLPNLSESQFIHFFLYLHPLKTIAVKLTVWYVLIHPSQRLLLGSEII